MARKSKNTPKLTSRQRFAALWRVGKISYKTAPVVLHVRIISSVLNSVLPIATTYFAAQTTTELAKAYNGDDAAGQAAIVYVLLTALLGVMTTAWSTVESYITRMAQYKLEAAVNDQLLNQFLSLDFWRYDDKNTADLLDKSRQFSNFFVYMFNTLGQILTSIVGLISSIIALLFVSWWLSLLLLVAVIPGLVIQYRLSKARTEHWANNVDARRKVYNIQWEMTQVQNIAEIRLYGLVKHLLGLRQKYRDQDEKVQIGIERKFISREFLASVIEAVAEVVALIYVTLQIIAHAMPIGQFLYVQQIVSRGLGSMRSVANSFISIDEDLANLAAYDEFMSLPAQDSGAKKLLSAPKTIEFSSVSFKYPHVDRTILNDVSFTVNKGDHIAIVGENGAGKSTLIKLLLGLYTPTTGQVNIGGIPTTDLDLDSWHAQIGVLQQASTIYAFARARENIEYGDVARSFSTARYEKATEAAEARGFLDELPKKDETYTTPWMEDEDGDSGVALSGGQQQRLALARNFYRDSPVVILDEPTSAIDALAESRIFKRLLEQKDKTIITISHRLSTVRRASVIYVLEHGRIVEQGTHAELIKKQGAYYTLFESQL